ncbi:MAG: EF-hand domain-containing protein, partial [Rickettsiales bacterium]|nr:EF-hand domain-containing protein [Rickettsiales bacterium]
SVLSTQNGIKNPFSKLDRNADASVSKSEFVTGRPKGVTESQAASRFAELDTAGTGSLTKSQLSQNSSSASAVKVTLSAQAQAFLLQNSPEQSGTTSPSSDNIFARLDTNSDSLLSSEEFISGRPSFASEEQAVAKFSILDVDGDGSLTESEASIGAANSAQAAGSGGKPPPPPRSSSVLSEIFDDLDTNEDGVIDITELMAGLQKEQEEQERITGSENSNQQTLELNQAIEAYGSQSNAYSTESIIT